MKYKKIDDHTLEVQRPQRTIEGETTEYSLNFLKSQERAILAQIERKTKEYRAGLEEVQEMIEKAKELGIIEVKEDEITRE